MKWKDIRVWGVAVALAAAFGAVVLANAWVCDDAYITFRSVEQLFAGHGPRWNPHERVQAFTHPLWFLLLAVGRVITPDPFLIAIVLSLALCLAALLVSGRFLVTDRGGWAVLIVLLISSKAFIDFASSGLENPLSFLLVAVFAVMLHRVDAAGSEPEAAAGGRLVIGGMLAVGLLLTTRHDLLLVALPGAVYVLVRLRRLGARRLVRWCVIGLSPFLLWTLFALVYYGFPFPNTAYAKLHVPDSGARLLHQGLAYFANSLRRDPVTLGVIAAGVVLGTRRSWPTRMLALGSVLYLGYVAKIGGDFMSGRFFAVPFFLAAIMLAQGRSRIGRAAIIAPALVANFLILSSPVRGGSGYKAAWDWGFENGIADERGYYFRDLSVWAWAHRDRRRPFPARLGFAPRGFLFRRSPEKVEVRANIGCFGYLAGVDEIILDPNGLTDPLLARLPAHPGARIGHFTRPVPDGYAESLRSGDNRLVDPGIRELYDEIRVVTQGPLFTAARVRAILRLNLGLARRPQRSEVRAPGGSVG